MNLNSLSGVFREVPFTAQKAAQAKAGHSIELIHTLLHRRFKALLSFPVWRPVLTVAEPLSS